MKYYFSTNFHEGLVVNADDAGTLATIIGRAQHVTSNAKYGMERVYHVQSEPVLGSMDILCDDQVTTEPMPTEPLPEIQPPAPVNS
jgi:hypothetical protein